MSLGDLNCLQKHQVQRCCFPDLLRQNLNPHQDMEVERTICERGIGVAEKCCKVFRGVQVVTTQFRFEPVRPKLSSPLTKNASDPQPEINENMKAVCSVANLTLSTCQIVHHRLENPTKVTQRVDEQNPAKVESLETTTDCNMNAALLTKAVNHIN